MRKIAPLVPSLEFVAHVKNRKLVRESMAD
jgi:hypothetical protein